VQGYASGDCLAASADSAVGGHLVAPFSFHARFRPSVEEVRLRPQDLWQSRLGSRTYEIT